MKFKERIHIQKIGLLEILRVSKKCAILIRINTIKGFGPSRTKKGLKTHP